MKIKYIKVGRPVDDSARWWASDLANRIGPSEAARQIGISRGTLAAVMAGLPVAAATELRVLHARRVERPAA